MVSSWVRIGGGFSDALKLGQMIAEVASLDAMQLEIEVPPEQISQVFLGGGVTARIDSTKTLTGLSVAKLHPRAEPNEEGIYAFEALTHLTPESGSLKPGMRGHATIDGNYRPLAWCIWELFWQQVRRW